MKHREPESRHCSWIDSRALHISSDWTPKAAHITRPRTVFLAGAERTDMGEFFP
jgi:hypothetical protein